MDKKIFLVALTALLVVASFSYAQTGHTETKAKKHGAAQMSGTDVFADGTHVTFMVHTNAKHKLMLKKMKMHEVIEPGTTHHVMVMVRDEKSGREFANVPVTITMTDADDNEQTKTGSYKEMMKTYEAYFNMPKKGKYQIKALFETQGQKRSIGFSYDLI